MWARKSASLIAPRKLLTMGLVVLMTTLGLAVTATPASAAGTCNGAAVTGRFSPGILLVEARNSSLDFTAVAAVCAMTNPDVTSMRMEGQGGGEISCTTGELSGTGRIVWGTVSGTELRSSVDWVSTHGLSEWVFVGTVKSGEFQGETWTMVFPAGGSNPAECLSPDGLENFAATATVNFA